ncbi:MAG: serine hydrolase domain-containing protein [Acidobacteriota bacterium]
MSDSEMGGGRAGRFAAAYQVAEEAIAARGVPGCAFGALAGGEVVLQGAAGHFTYEAESPFVRPETVFDLASVSKVVATTAAAMLLTQRGRFDVDSRLGEVLPEFVAHRAKDDPAREITIRHLLSHASGLPGYVEFFRTARDRDSLLRACFDLQLEAMPGTRAEYSDPGFILLGKALEVCAGESLDSFAARELFAPLGLASTCFHPAAADRAAIPPTEIDERFRQRRIQGEVQDENAWVLGGVAGHAGLFSNVPDLLRFAKEILEGAAGRSELFARETVEMFARRQAPAGSSRALGWDTPSEKSSAGRHFSPHSIGHLGYSGCSLWIDLEAAVAVALLTNRTWPDRGSQLIRQVRPAFHDAVREAL